MVEFAYMGVPTVPKTLEQLTPQDTLYDTVVPSSSSTGSSPSFIGSRQKTRVKCKITLEIHNLGPHPFLVKKLSISCCKLSKKAHLHACTHKGFFKLSRTSPRSNIGL